CSLMSLPGWASRVLYHCVLRCDKLRLSIINHRSPRLRRAIRTRRLNWIAMCSVSSACERQLECQEGTCCN
ncbi:MAG TPA: hypothetical protein PLT57_10565, partial [Accumulibacter sp.]|nr:hypothetical protein [Accumulibacter sp.]